MKYIFHMVWAIVPSCSCILHPFIHTSVCCRWMWEVISMMSCFPTKAKTIITTKMKTQNRGEQLLACLTITITCTAVSHRFINEVNQHCLDSWNGNLARSEKRSNFVLTPWRWLCMMIRREICRLSGHLSWPLHSIHTPSLRRSE